MGEVKKTTAFLLTLLFYASILPWTGRAEYYNHHAHDITSDTGNLSGFDNITATTRVRAPNIGAAAGTDNGAFKNLTVTGTPTFADNTINGVDVIDNTITSGKLVSYYGYTLGVFTSVDNPTDNVTVYFGNIPVFIPTTTAALSRVYIPKTGTIKTVYITAASTANVGSNEAWSLYVVVDNSTSTLIKSITSTSNPRVWDNTAMSISVSQGSYLEIKSINPTWATNPTEMNYSGNVYIE